MKALLLCLALVGCAAPSVMAFGAQRLTEEGWYEQLFRDMERCSGRKADFGPLEFYVVPRGGLDAYDADALWSPDYRLFIESPHEMNAPLLAHEFLHYITQMTHLPNGQDGPFEDVLRMCGLL